MGSETDNAAEMASRLAEALERVGELEARLSALEAERDPQEDEADYDKFPSGLAGADFRPKDPGLEFPPGRPFEITWNPKDAKWQIYLPEGCVRLGKKAAEYSGGTSADSMFDVSAAEKLYCHIYKEGADYKFSIDDEEEKSKETYHFLVAEFDSGLSEVAVQHVLGMVNFGGGGEAVVGAGCFALEYDEDDGTTDFVNCYYKYGELLDSISGTGADSFATGGTESNPKYVALKCSATSNNSGAELQGYANFGAMQTACEDPAYIVVPLYALYMGDVEEDEEDGESGSGSVGGESGSGGETRQRVMVACDFRTMPRMQVIENLESSSGNGSGSGSSGS